jgi:DNA-binding NtrC family response regulator
VPAPAPVQRVLVVEDLEDARTSLQELLQMSLRLEVDTAEDGAAGLAMLAAKPYSLVITDLRMPRLGGMKLIEAIQAERIPVTVIVTTGTATSRTRSTPCGWGCTTSSPSRRTRSSSRSPSSGRLRDRMLQDEVAALRRALGERHAFQNVLSRSPKMHDLFELIGHVAGTGSTVLIRGETGTGKEQIARAIHQASALSRPGDFVAVNCGALNENLLESELFGHEKGSYTGADRKRIGRFELADKGTLFLDEIGDVPMSMQIKLLRVLQERRFERVGGTEPIEVDVRIVAATHQDMEKLVRDKKFREDLYYRLNVVRIDLPPLRERTEDIPVLVSHFCQRFARPGQKPPTVSPEALALLMKSPWPGNVRQLENAIERACVTARDGVIRMKDLPPEVGRPPGGGPNGGKNPFQVDLSRPLTDQLEELRAAFEERYIRRALKRSRGHVGKCAKITGLSRRSITDKIAQYGIKKEEFKGEEG